MRPRRLENFTYVRFLIAALTILFATSIQSAAQTKRLDIVVDHGSVRPRVDPGDTESLYVNGQPTAIIQQGQAGGPLVPVEVGMNGQLELYLVLGDTVHWVQATAQGGYMPYPHPILFEPQAANPCSGAQTATQGPSCLLSAAGSPYYSCEGCGDPRIVVHSSNAGSLIAEFKLIQTSADALKASAASSVSAASEGLKTLAQERDIDRADKRQLENVLERILRYSRYAEADAFRITGKTRIGMDVLKHPSTAAEVLPPARSSGGPEIDLLCAKATDGTPGVSVGPWHGDLKRTDISWVNARNLADSWSVSAATINSNPPDPSCANKKFVAAKDYAGVCVAQKPPDSMSFDLEVTKGDCAEQKTLHCMATAQGGRCALATN